MTGPGEASPTCPWCSAIAAPGATTCTACGAALAQRESIGDLVIPGLTDVDPALRDFDARPLHLRGPSPSQGLASGVVVAAAAGGPIGLAVLGGLGAVAAAEYLGARHDANGEPLDLDHVGKPSEAVLQALRQLPDAAGDRKLPRPASAEEDAPATPRSEADPPPG